MSGLFILACILLYIMIILMVVVILKDKFPTLISTGCTGDCRQGRDPCNCHLKDEGLDK